MFSTLLAAFLRARARARALAELRRMSDRRLRDIGLTREDIGAFVSGRL